MRFSKIIPYYPVTKELEGQNQANVHLKNENLALLELHSKQKTHQYILKEHSTIKVGPFEKTLLTCVLLYISWGESY